MVYNCNGFNPRTPCGVRLKSPGFVNVMCKFQSTHSLRSATVGIGDVQELALFQSTHSLRSATSLAIVTLGSLVVSIHALLAECDGYLLAFDDGFHVSIHALLAECDPRIRAWSFRFGCFNPRTPCGVRLQTRRASTRYEGFNPRTPCGVRPAGVVYILTLFRFNPRTPCGVRRARNGSLHLRRGFQSTHSLRSATLYTSLPTAP